MNEAQNAAPGKVVVLNFAEAKQPVFKETRGGAFVKFGDDNQYPNYLLDLFSQASKHGPITAGKATYIAGNGWQIMDGKEDAAAATFIAKANRYDESLASITTKVALDLEIFGGYYLQVIWNYTGTRLAEVYHLDYMSVRSNADNTQFIYKENWKDSREVGKVYPAFNPSNKMGSQVVYVKEYRPGLKTYALPGYMPALNYISAEIEVGKHVLGNSQNGFKPGKLITIPGPEPSLEEEKDLTRNYRKATTGASGLSFLLSFVRQIGDKHVVDDLGASDLTREDFSNVDKLIQGNVFSAHKVTTPALFGIATPGSLGQRTELQDGYEIFKNTYVNGKQQFLEEWFNKLAKYAGALVPIRIIPTDPIETKLGTGTIATVMTREEIRAQAGLPAEVKREVSQSQVITDSIAAMSPLVANKVLNSLTQNEIRGLANLPPIEGGDSIPGPDGAAAPAPAKMQGFAAAGNKQVHDNEDLALELFGQYGSPKSNYRILKTRKIRFSDDADELSEFQQMSFAEGKMSQLEASILDLINKDKRITPEALADVLKVKVGDIEKLLLKA